jgi:hypothetical protein
MMKKLLVLMLVFGMTSMASAVLQISVHNYPPGGETWDPLNPPESEIWIGTGQYLQLDVWTTTTIDSGVGEGYFLLGVLPAEGTLSGGVSKWPNESGVNYYSGLGDNYLPGGEKGDLLTIATFSPITGTVFDEILFYCVGAGDAVVHLYETDWTTPTLLDTVIIHQVVPEPMTIALLGLGGLFLRRRKK